LSRADNSWKMTAAKNLKPAELDRLFEAAKKYDRRVHLMVMVTYNGAFMVSELIHLKVKHFDFAGSKVSVIPLKKAGRRRMKTTDGVKMVDRALPEPIIYPMPKNVIAVVEKYVRENELTPESFLFPGKSKSCAVVKLECPGGHISKRMVQWIFDRLSEEAKIKIPGRGIQSLKHSRLVEVAGKTNDPQLVRELGRHNSPLMGEEYVKFVQDQIGGKT